jgi:Flp pilus assembly protein TadD
MPSDLASAPGEVAEPVLLAGADAMQEGQEGRTDEASRETGSEAGSNPLAAEAPGLPLADMASENLVADKSANENVRDLTAAALAKFSENDYRSAADLLSRALKLVPNSPSAHNNLALALWRANRSARGEALARRAITLDPNYIPAHRLLAEILRERDDVSAALASYERLLALEPDNAVAHNNLGLLLRKGRRFDEAAAAFARARALKPDNLSIRFNELSLTDDAAALSEAIACCRRLLEKGPENVDILTNLATSLQFSGRVDEAMVFNERAIAVDPAHRQARFNLSILALLRGDYGRGWNEYEHRWNLPEVKKPHYRQPLWAGEELNGATILLQSEQGWGDTIQCLRYVPMVAARSGKIVLRVDRPLQRLAASVPTRVMISPSNVRLPEFDYWCPLLSLSRIFGTRVENIPADVPYLRIRSGLIERWRRRLASLPGLRVGLTWAGNPQHVNDFRRSIGLDRLTPLWNVPGVSFISLQVGSHAKDLGRVGAGGVLDLAAELTDFAETAGAIMNLDVVIAVDTSVVHLAGALAKPVWVMLPFSPDWRWLLDRGDSPWYPTLKLYRQRAPGDWDSVVARLTADLAALAAKLAKPRDESVQYRTSRT